MANVPNGGLRRGIDPAYALWAVMALPGAYVVAHGLLGMKFPYVMWTGIAASLFLAAALLVTPLMFLSKKLLFLKKRRRYLGVAAFAYTVLHVAIWMVQIDLTRVLKSFLRPEILTGWIAFAIFIPLAFTSTDAAVRRLGPKWKTLQRWVYLGAAFTLVHWLMTSEGWTLALTTAAPVLALSVWRLIRWRSRSGAAV